MTFMMDSQPEADSFHQFPFTFSSVFIRFIRFRLSLDIYGVNFLLFLDILWRTGLISTSNCPDEKTSDGLVWVETNGPVIWTCNKPEAAEV